MRKTHTYATLEVPHAIYMAIRSMLDRADYSHVFIDGKEEKDEVMDMTGIALKSRGGSTQADISISTLISSKTGRGMIDFSMNSELTQMDLDKCREIIKMLMEAVEASISDELLYKFLIEKIGLPERAALTALMDFREMRQGSKGTVYPS